jgi:hypothetical protein
MTVVVKLPGTNITLHEVLGGSEKDLVDLLAIHRELFPDYVYYQPYMQKRAKLPPNANPDLVEHWWLVRVAGQPAGVRFFVYVPHRDCGLGLAVGIRPTYRKATFGEYQRLSEILLLKTLEYLTIDAEKSGRMAPIGMVSEIEDYILPRCIEYGYIPLNIDYQEPSFVQDSVVSVSAAEPISFRPIVLACLPTDKASFDPSDPVVLTNVVKAFLVDYYGLAENHQVVRQALNSIESEKGRLK